MQKETKMHSKFLQQCSTTTQLENRKGESMKRKIALLLAVAMILSMLPANLFAAPPAPGSVSRINVLTGGHSRMPGAEVSFTIPADTARLMLDPQHVLNPATSAALRIELTDAAFVSTGSMAWVVPAGAAPRHGDLPATPAPDAPPLVDVGFGAPAAVGSTFNLLNPAPGQDAAAIADRTATTNWYSGFPAVAGADVTMFAFNNTRAYLDVEMGPVEGSLVIKLPFHVRINNTAASMRVLHGNTVVAEGPLVNVPGASDMEIAYGDVVYFEYDARLSNLTVRETGSAGTLVPMTGTTTLAVRLTSPANYTWGNLANVAVTVPSGRGQVTSVNVIQPPFFLSGNRQELIITFTAERFAGAHGAGLMDIQIAGLMLQSNDNAPVTGALNVPVAVGTVTAPGAFSQNADIFGAALPGVNITGTGWTPIADTDNHSRTVLVARRVLRGLIVTTVEAEDDDQELPAIRSGYVIGGEGNAIRPVFGTTADWVTSGDYAAAMGGNFTSGRTAILRIEEVVPNSLDVARTRPITFTLPEGVIVTGIEWRYAVENINDRAWTRVARPALTLSQSVNDVRFVDNNTVELRPNLQLHQTGGYRTRTVSFDIRFYVSVEAGYAASVAEELVVNVGGNGVAVLGANGDNETVATIYDPVTIRHEGGAVHVDPTVGRENNIYHTDAGRLVITETAGGMLQEGTQLQVAVVRHYGIGLPLQLSRGDVISSSSDLSLLVVERVDTPAIGNAASSVFTLQVQQASEEGAPGTIVIDGLALFGHVYQGEIYYLIVTGAAIAENHLNVAGIGGQVSSAFPNLAVGIFTTPPYFTEIVEFVAREGEGAPDRRALSLANTSFDAARTVNGAPELIWVRLAGMQHEAGLVQARAFATAAGVDSDDVIWNGADGVATISGWDNQGQWVTVILTRDSAIAQIIRGGTTMQTVDIAEFAGQSGPAGTLTPVFRNDRIYLPLRFMFNVFGYSADYTIERDGTAAVVRPL
jgi:hypothetical protein